MKKNTGWMLIAGMLLVMTACTAAEVPPETQPGAEAMTVPVGEPQLEKVPEMSMETEMESEPVQQKERLGFVDGNISAGGELCGGADGWIYYAGKSEGRYLCKAKPDGSEKTRLAEDKPKYINVLDGWVYYVNQTDGSAIYRIRTDGTDREKLTGEGCGNLRVTENGMYYNQRPDPTVPQTTYRADLNGENIVSLAEDRMVAAYHDGMLYCYNREALDRLDVDTGIWETIFEGYVDDVSADETGVYFSDISGTRYDGQYVFCHLDNEGNLKVLVEEPQCDFYTYHDGMVYYSSSHAGYACKYRLDTVTGETSAVLPLSEQMYDHAGEEAGVTFREYWTGQTPENWEPAELVYEMCYYAYAAEERLYMDAVLLDSMDTKGAWECWVCVDGEERMVWD